jgi:hypothetical protein
LSTHAVLGFSNNLWGPGNEGVGDRNNSTHAQKEQFQHYLNKYIRNFWIGFASISSVKVFVPTCVIYKKDSGDEHKFCTTLMEKTVGEIGILNSH